MNSAGRSLWIPSSSVPRLSAGEVHLWRFPLSVSAFELPTLQRLLSRDEVQRAGRFLDRCKAEAFIAGRGRLRQLLALYLDIDSAEIDFVYGVDGKPALHKKSEDDFSFNLSHSGEWALLAVTTGASVGVDIEKIDPLLDYERLTVQFFTPVECASLRSVHPHRRRREFYRLWTRKEALLKGQGSGFSLPGRVSHQPWQIGSFWTVPGYVAAVATNNVIHTLRRWQPEAGGLK